jgi:hypothetical protein
MLSAEEWDSVIARLVGVTFRGTERVLTRHVLDQLKVPNDRGERQKVSKQLGPHMRAAGWYGPVHLRVPGVKDAIAGYWRRPGALPPLRAVDDEAALSVDPGLGEEGDLPHALETVTRLGLKELRRILRLPLDEGNGNLLRSKVTAALGAINCQLRADEARLRTKTAGNVLDRLERLMAEQRKLIPKQHLAVSPPAVHPDELASGNDEGLPREVEG